MRFVGEPIAPNAMSGVQWTMSVAHWVVRSAQASGDADKASGRIEGPSTEIEADAKNRRAFTEMGPAFRQRQNSTITSAVSTRRNMVSG